MGKKPLGEKHVCGSCGAKFYDLGKTQPLCPKCGSNPKDTSSDSVTVDDSIPLDDDGGVLHLRAVFEGAGEDEALDGDVAVEEEEADEDET